MDAEQIHEAACRAGATVMGSEDAPHHYIMNAVELARFVVLLNKPCPVPLPLAKENAPLD